MDHATLADNLRYEVTDLPYFSLVRFHLAPLDCPAPISVFTQPQGLLEIGLCLHGRWHFSLPNEKPVAVTGSVGMVHLPGASWKSRFASGTACQGMGIAISTEQLARYVGDSPFARTEIRSLVECKRDSLAHFDVASSEALTLAASVCAADWNDPLQRLLLEAKSMELLYLLLRAPGDARPGRSAVSREDEKKLQAVREMILADLEATKTIADLARIAGLSPSKLKSSFKNRFGSTIHDYIRQAKLDHARRMIESGEMNVTEAALSAGYTSFGHFSRIFRETFGFLPRQALRRSRIPAKTVSRAA